MEARNRHNGRNRGDSDYGLRGCVADGALRSRSRPWLFAFALRGRADARAVRRGAAFGAAQAKGPRSRARRRVLCRHRDPGARDVRSRDEQLDGERSGRAMGPGLARTGRRAGGPARKAVLSGGERPAPPRTGRRAGGPARKAVLSGGERPAPHQIGSCRSLRPRYNGSIAVACGRHRSMTKAELIETVARATHLEKKTAARAIELIFDHIARAIRKDKRFWVPGFGTFSV